MTQGVYSNEFVRDILTIAGSFANSGGNSGALAQHQINTQFAKTYNEQYQANLHSINNSAQDFTTSQKDPRFRRAAADLQRKLGSGFEWNAQIMRNPRQKAMIINQANENARKDAIKDAGPFLKGAPQYAGSVVAVDEDKFNIDIDVVLNGVADAEGKGRSAEFTLKGGLHQVYKMPVVQTAKGMVIPGANDVNSLIFGVADSMKINLGINAPKEPELEVVENQELDLVGIHDQDTRNFIGTARQLYELESEKAKETMDPSRRKQQVKTAQGQLTGTLWNMLTNKQVVALRETEELRSAINKQFTEINAAGTKVPFLYDSSDPQHVLSMRMLQDAVTARKINLRQLKLTASKNSRDILGAFKAETFREGEYDDVIKNWEKSWDDTVIKSLDDIDEMLIAYRSNDLDAFEQRGKVLKETIDKNNAQVTFAQNVVKLVEAQFEVNNQGAAFLKWLGGANGVVGGMAYLQMIKTLDPKIKAIAMQGSRGFNLAMASGLETENLVSSLTTMDEIFSETLGGGKENQAAAFYMYDQKFKDNIISMREKILWLAEASQGEKDAPETLQAQGELIILWAQLDGAAIKSPTIMKSKETLGQELPAVTMMNDTIGGIETFLKEMLEFDDKQMENLRKIYVESNKTLPEVKRGIIKELNGHRERLKKSSVDGSSEKKIGMLDNVIDSLSTQTKKAKKSFNELFNQDVLDAQKDNANSWMWENFPAIAKKMGLKKLSDKATKE